MATIRKVGVLGAGQMGAGIVQVFAEAGYDLVVVDEVESTLHKAVASIEKRLLGRVEKGKLEDLADCDLIEEAVPENLELKKNVFAKLDGICKAETIFGTNTSGLSVTDMAAATKRGDRLLLSDGGE